MSKRADQLPSRRWFLADVIWNFCMRYVWKMSWMWEEPPQHARTTSSEDEEEV
jgi:hypothetical protein